MATPVSSFFIILPIEKTDHRSVTTVNNNLYICGIIKSQLINP